MKTRCVLGAIGLFAALSAQADLKARAVTFGLQAGRFASKPGPQVPRDTLLAVVELVDGTVLRSALVQGSLDGKWRLATAIFPEFQLDKVRRFGLAEARPGSFPSFNELSGFRVTVYTGDGAIRVLDRSAELYSTRVTTRGDYRALPDIGSTDALPPSSEVRLSIRTLDGMNISTTAHIDFESVSGEFARLDIRPHVDAGVMADNASSTITRSVPMTLNRARLHRIRIRIQGTTTGLSTDDVQIAGFKAESRTLGGDWETLFDTAGTQIRLELKGQSWWQSAIFNRRQIPNDLAATTLGYEMLTGADDLRLNTDNERTNSRFFFDLVWRGRAATTAELPTRDQIRRDGTFSSNGIALGEVALGESIKLPLLNALKIRPDLGRAGEGFLNTLGEDQWDFDGLSLFQNLGDGKRRIIFSEWQRTRVRRSGPSEITLNLTTQTQFVPPAPPVPPLNWYVVKRA